MLPPASSEARPRSRGHRRPGGRSTSGTSSQPHPARGPQLTRSRSVPSQRAAVPARGRRARSRPPRTRPSSRPTTTARGPASVGCVELPAAGEAGRRLDKHPLGTVIADPERPRRVLDQPATGRPRTWSRSTRPRGPRSIGPSGAGSGQRVFAVGGLDGVRRVGAIWRPDRRDRPRGRPARPRRRALPAGVLVRRHRQRCLRRSGALLRLRRPVSTSPSARGAAAHAGLSSRSCQPRRRSTSSGCTAAASRSTRRRPVPRCIVSSASCTAGPSRSPAGAPGGVLVVWTRSRRGPEPVRAADATVRHVRRHARSVGRCVIGWPAAWISPGRSVPASRTRSGSSSTSVARPDDPPTSGHQWALV